MTLWGRGTDNSTFKIKKPAISSLARRLLMEATTNKNKQQRNHNLICLCRTSWRHPLWAELCKWIFAMTLPLERSCGSRTLWRHSPQQQNCGTSWRNFFDWVAEAELRHDITPRAELRKQNFMKTFPSIAELWNFMKKFPSDWGCVSGPSPWHYP